MSGPRGAIAAPTAAASAPAAARLLTRLEPLRRRAALVQARLERLPRPPAWAWVTLLVVVLTLPTNYSPPFASNNIDISWITGLHVAAHLGLHWGSAFNFEYGPLGYLTWGNLFYDGTGIPADLVGGAIFVATVALVARALCGSLGLLGGGLATFVIARIGIAAMDRVELVAPILVAWAILALRRRGGPLEWRETAGIAALAAFAELAKLSVGVVGLVVIGVLAAVALLESGRPLPDRLRSAAIPLGSFVLALAVLWLLAGQNLGDLPAYVRNSVELISGNADATGFEAANLSSEYWVAGVSILLLGVAVFIADRRLGWLLRAAFGVLWALFAWISFRHGFVRHTPGHAAVFFVPLLLLVVMVMVRRGRRFPGVLAGAVPLGASWHIGSWTVVLLCSVSTTNVTSWVNLMLAPNYRHAVQTSAITRLRASYALPPALVARMRGQTVHFDPFEASLAYAFPDVRWDPPPVFQSYDAYTAHLDDLDAAFLAGPRAPRYILRENIGEDGRNPRFESPRYMLEMMCRYRQVMLTTRWQLLERGPSRCGAPIPAGGEPLTLGRRAALPAPTGDSIVTASFQDLSLGLKNELGALLFKRHVINISVGLGLLYRFVPGHAGNPHVMSFPACLGWSGRLIDARPYPEVAIGHLPGLYNAKATESGTYRVVFQRVPFRC